MTISAVDTYFGDRLAEDFERQFDLLDEDSLGDILATIFQSGAGELERRKFAHALQHREPKREVVRMFRTYVDVTTYQEPGVITREVGRFGERNLWGEVDFRWRGKSGKSLKTESAFRGWVARRHAIAHRAGRPRGGTGAGRTAEHVSWEEARDCLNFFTRLIGVVDWRLNKGLYGHQARRRKSEIAVFDAEPAFRQPFVPPGRPPARSRAG